MKAFVFPGQASQFVGMGERFKDQPAAGKLLQEAEEILGFDIFEVMCSGTAEELQQTKVTQPAVFLHSVISYLISDEELQPDYVAGHSLGEFSALVASQALSFSDGLRLVAARAMAMQHACEAKPGTMAAIVGLEDKTVEEACDLVAGIVVAANYNCPGQLVISGEIHAVQEATTRLQEAGARRAIMLPVGGAFHSPLMQPAQEELSDAIAQTTFNSPICPIIQNVDALAQQDPEIIKENLISQLTSPVRWTQSVEQMLRLGVDEFVEVGGSGKVLLGMIRRITRESTMSAL